MSEQKRRFLERTTLHVSPAPTVVGADSIVVGNIRGKGQFVICGEVQGDGELDGALVLSAAASWYGYIRAHQAIVAGKIVGGIIVKDKLEIGHTAVIRGHVSARTVAIAKGAIVDGEIEVTSGIPIQEFAEKRGD
ncbi:MAG: polymer-forming cytoskeletal protein [Pseudomonadota bacterium]|nr:polymer-forming cytoskeletal protein [Pseudomonadota bacterium]